MDMATLEELKKRIFEAESILVNIHRNPDLDSVGSAMAMSHALTKIGKKVTVISPDFVPSPFSFLDPDREVKKIDFSAFDFSSYDLFVILDTGSLSHLTGKKEGILPALPTVLIDHHAVNTVEADLRYLIPTTHSTAEIIYHILTEWKIKIDQKIATALLAGILSDTLMFRFSGNDPQVIETVAELIRKGGDKEKVTKAMFEGMDMVRVKLYGKLLSEAQFDQKGSFVYVTIPHAVYEAYDNQKGIRDAASDYLRGVKGALFAVVGIEENPGELFLSFRSTEYDVSKLAIALGGGGHRQAAGATVYGVYEESIKKILALFHSA